MPNLPCFSDQPGTKMKTPTSIAKMAAYKPKKSGEDDPAIVPILERGMRYIDEFAQPQDAKAAAAAKQAGSAGNEGGDA